MKVTRSKEEAQGLLFERRARLIIDGICVATEIARRDGTVHSRAVRDEMVRRGLVAADERSTT